VSLEHAYSATVNFIEELIYEIAHFDCFRDKLFGAQLSKWYTVYGITYLTTAT